MTSLFKYKEIIPASFIRAVSGKVNTKSVNIYKPQLFQSVSKCHKPNKTAVTNKWAIIPPANAGQNGQISHGQTDGKKKERAKNKETQAAPQPLECGCWDREGGATRSGMHVAVQ